MTAADIAFAPLLPWALLGPLFGLAALVLLAATLRRARGAGWRWLAAATLALALLNPSLVQEEREPIRDVAVVVVDESPSQATGERAARADAALADLRERLAGFEDLDVRVVRAGGEDIEETRLFDALESAVADVPRRRVAGAVLITDGQVHDVPPPAALDGMGPVHTLLTGRRDEADRRLVVEQAPAFGLVGRTVTVTLRVDDLPDDPAAAGIRSVDVRVSRDGEPLRRERLAVGRDTDLSFRIEHGGPSVFEFEAEAADRELTLANNRAVVVVNGVRDRLRVLLVSGEPHPGERTWRNILKSDPSVDLVHFTILRPPEGQDGTPINELSLIAFPIRDLFELRLNEFDLIIFDRYRRRGVLHSTYLENIAEYVLGGGAFLEASGPDFADIFSLYRTPLGRVLPGEPTGEIVERGFRPAVTDAGLRHPVTAALDGVGTGDEPPDWGRWLRQIDVAPTGGTVVMAGADNRPLLILERAGEGRVAQLTSDHIWLWSRGFEGGGPQAELLRRLAHWLMKEPALEENDLRADVSGTRIAIERRSLEPGPREVTVLTPSGERTRVELTEAAPGRAVGQYVAEEPGIFRLADEEQTALAVVGSPNPPELSDLRTTTERLAPAAEATGGAMVWLADDGVPDVRRVAPDRDAAGRDWIGLRANGDYVVTGVREAPLMPAALALLLAVGGLMAAWRREGR